LAQGEPVDSSSLDIDNADVQEIVDALSVMVLHLRDENAKITATLTALLEKQNHATQTPIGTKIGDMLVEQPTAMSGAGKMLTAHHCSIIADYLAQYVKHYLAV
jgi:hypothetical protein